ncbi:hypothetical protein CKM354_000417700 [Cercospora kikuchii]|uniref:Uncharacterized protein n=1 Tax=Cercospora kikuchii TaxID=84275 RepID=A0A9P3CJD1_9PEZI|nr:uncharacterized protein CKM354_000417700 [Cercospora kikuchii]GIZ40855.1 hypothetical protein CKM354_000417700 [Cercospora kikuchii]
MLSSRRAHKVAKVAKKMIAPVADSGRATLHIIVRKFHRRKKNACPRQQNVVGDPVEEPLKAATREQSSAGMADPVSEGRCSCGHVCPDNRDVTVEANAIGVLAAANEPHLEQQEQHVPSPDELRRARRAKWATFDGEDESDYTTGPIRIVAASDGVADFPSLLLNLKLSTAIQSAIHAEQEMEELGTSASVERVNWLDLRSRVADKIADLELRLLITKGQARSATEDDDERIIDAEASRDELRKFKAFRLAIRREYEELDMRIQHKKDELLVLQKAVTAVLEEAFVDANLVKPARRNAQPPYQEWDVDAVFDDFVRLEYVETGDVSGDQTGRLEDGMLRSCDDTTFDDDPATEEKQQARDAYYEAQCKLQEAQESFDNRADIEYREMQDVKDEDALEFSHRCIRRGRELTRALIEAEEAEAKARAATERAGISLPQQESGFCDRADDGYGSEYERGGVAQAPRGRIFECMASIPDAADPHKQDTLPRPEADDWKYRDMDFGESRSVIDEGSQRRRIDKWSIACSRGGL